ncbi:hypothetical protein LCGC14_0141690 [marine sediment metagenome]|uniref:Uncharacterized protein n=1 Tax=marine sediment metagenome TaxID=412755 RepID=A0A0F9V4L1_9ZZZZ
MSDETVSPTKMSKNQLAVKLLSCGYSEKDLLDDEGKKLKRPELLAKLKAHQSGEQGLSELTKVVVEEDDDDDVGIKVEAKAVVQQDTKSETVVGTIQDVVVKNEVPETKLSNRDRDIFKEVVTKDVEPNEALQDAADTYNSAPPTPSDPRWTQYVLGKFDDDEMDKGNPRVEGLRRIAGELVGVIMEEGCDLIAAPSEENNFRACAKAWVVFLTENGYEKRFEALADANAANCFEDYATYLVAMADTRAKGRVYRNALGLKRVVAAEEVSKTVAATADVQPGGAIHGAQITMIRMIAERQGFSIDKVVGDLNIVCELSSDGDINLRSLTYEDALAISTKMREMKEAKEKE